MFRTFYKLRIIFKKRCSNNKLDNFSRRAVKIKAAILKRRSTGAPDGIWVLNRTNNLYILG